MSLADSMNLALIVPIYPNPPHIPASVSLVRARSAESRVHTFSLLADNLSHALSVALREEALFFKLLDIICGAIKSYAKSPLHAA